jgi:putative DNA primase/helicase
LLHCPLIFPNDWRQDMRAFQDAIRLAGLIPPDIIEPGKFHRFPGEGKRKSNTAAWCKLFDDRAGGVFGDHSTGLDTHWFEKRETSYTPAELESFKRQVTAAKAQDEAERKAKQAEAAAQATAIWNAPPSALEATQPGLNEHPYLVLKGIQPHGAKVYHGGLTIGGMGCNGALMIPTKLHGKITSLQFINRDGDKRFLYGGEKGGSLIGKIEQGKPIHITEGFATGASIHEATGYPVVVAFDASNLKKMALALRAKYPDAVLVLCADDDYLTAGNPGMTKATKAAQSVGGLLAIPDFGTDRPASAKDFNDMMNLCGTEAIGRAIANASAPSGNEHQAVQENAPADDSNGWAEPQPLTVKIEGEPYPIDALPDTIRAAVEEVGAFVKAPVPMVATCAISAVSVAAQAHYDVQRAEKLHSPIGLFTLILATSGERKSTSDDFFMQAIGDYEKKETEAAKPFVKEYNVASAIWEAKHNGIKDKIRQEAKNKKPTAGLEMDLRDLENKKPEAPRIPRLTYSNITTEELSRVLAKKWPSGGVVTAEGGIVFGSHAMKGDAVMGNLATLNALWDGGDVQIDRKTTESFTVHGARLTVALQVQPETIETFFEKNGTLARGTGFLARFLLAWPESTQGHRPFTEAPVNWPSLAAFNRRITEILNQPVPMDENGSLIPLMLTLTPEAKAAWVEYHDAIESELVSGGELFDVRDVASKSADNAARLAALFHVFEGVIGAIGADTFHRASRITAWHLNESRRFFGELGLPAELADAARLDKWLIDYCRRERTHLVPIAKLLQGGPGRLRSKATIEIAMSELADASMSRARWVQDGKRKMIAVNPALLSEGAS